MSPLVFRKPIRSVPGHAFYNWVVFRDSDIVGFVRRTREGDWYAYRPDHLQAGTWQKTRGAAAGQL